MKSSFALTTAFYLSVAPAWADLAASPAIASLEAGVVCAPPPVGSRPAPDTLAGVTHIIAEEPDFVTNARRVPAVLDIGFGVKAQSVNPDGAAPVTVLITHPEMGQTDVTEQSFVTSISGSDPSLTFYQFDYAYEMVLGTWEFTAMSGDEILYSVSFEVVDPRLVPELADVCGYQELLS